MYKLVKAAVGLRVAPSIAQEGLTIAREFEHEQVEAIHDVAELERLERGLSTRPTFDSPHESVKDWFHGY